jgi:dihydroflavonol-4-reductase
MFPVHRFSTHRSWGSSAPCGISSRRCLRIFLTGGTGYIGGALAPRLVEAGHEVRALVRPTSRRQALDDLGVECVVGDLLEPEGLAPALMGADWVVHAAAELDMEAPLAAMRRTNAEGSDNMAREALAAEAGRFLALSSVAAFGGSPADGSPATEETGAQEPLPTRYCVTKSEGERAVDRWEARGLPVNVVYPSLVYGPPGKARGANLVLRDVVRGRMPVMVGGDRRVSWIYLADLVEGLLKVIERAPAGKRYLMTGEAQRLDVTVREVCRLAGVEAPRRSLPLGVAKGLAMAGSAWTRLTGRRLPLTLEVVRSISRHWCFDDGLARRELDWHPRGLADGLPPAVEFLLEPEDGSSR